MSVRPSGQSTIARGGDIRLTSRHEALLPARAREAARQQLWTHLWLPLLAFAAALSILSWLQLDWLLAHRIYAWEGYRWVLKKAFLTEALLHRSGHDLSVAAWVVVLGTWLIASRRESLRVWRMPLGYLTLSVLLATLAVSWVKSWSNVDCPWDINGLGGTRPYIGLLESRPAGLPDGRCFPAGHASGGYAWMALYFFFLMTRPQLRWRGLAVGAGIGLIFGIAQQFRGAHFLSHDLWTAMICWTVAFGLYRLFLYRLFQRGNLRRSHPGVAAN